jgi:hypothetical protein
MTDSPTHIMSISPHNDTSFRLDADTSSQSLVATTSGSIQHRQTSLVDTDSRPSSLSPPHLSLYLRLYLHLRYKIASLRLLGCTPQPYLSLSSTTHLTTHPTAHLPTYLRTHTHAMAPRKKTPASNTKDKGVLQPSKAGVKKATKEKVARNKAVKETAVPNTQAPVKPFKNGLVNLTKMPDHLLMK